MPDQARLEIEGLSRRNLFLGAGALAGAATVLGAIDSAPGVALAAVDSSPRPEALGAAIPNLTYIGIDALGFRAEDEDGPTDTPNTYYDPATGTGLLSPPGYIQAPLTLPAGSVVRQINIAFQGSPIVEINRRQLATPVALQQVFQQTTTNVGGGPQSQTFDLASPVAIEQDSTYTLRLFLAGVVAGNTVYGVTVGYSAATQGFVPFAGSVPRVLDTREPGAGGKLNPGEERVIALGNPGARSAVINLTVTETEGVAGAGGFVAAFRGDIAWPGNSSINWSFPDQDIANSAIVALDSAGQIKIRGGAQPTHVVIDRVGWFI